MKAEYEASTGSDSDLSTSDSESDEEDSSELTSLSGLKKTLLTLLKKNRKLRKGLASNEEQIKKLNKRIKKVKRRKKIKVEEIVYPQDPEISRRNDATAIFPEEIWRMILGHLTDPPDLWHCSNTCELFGKILSELRPGWMMEVALPHLYRHLNKNKLLECRLVCTGWNKKINSFLEDHPSLRPHDSNNDPRRLEQVNPVLEKNLGERNIYGFWTRDCNPDLQTTFTGNPFLGRYVTLMMCRGHDNKPQEETVDKFYEKIYTFLRLYGKEIFYLNFWYHTWNSNLHSEVDADGTLEKSKFIQLITVDLFHFVPNLRKLRFGGLYYDVRVTGDDVIRPESLPPAPKLDSLEVDNNFHRNHQDPIAQALMLRYHAQLRKLYVTTDNWNEEVNNLEWPILTELNWKISWSFASFCGRELRMSLISKLELDVDKSTNFDKLMQSICELSSTTRLNTLRLSGLDSVLEQPKEMSRCRRSAPPTLETLELENFLVTGPRCSYTFLLLRCFPHIKNLHIFLRSPTYPKNFQHEFKLLSPINCKWKVRKVSKWDRPDEDVDVHKNLCGGGGGGGGMYKSTIWELLPSLNVFTFQWDVYTREGYEEYSRKKRFPGQT